MADAPLLTARLRLRPLHPLHDAAAMLALLNDPGFLRGIGDRHVRTEDQARDYLHDWAAEHRARHGFAHWAVETHAGDFVGTAGLLCKEGLPAPHVGYALLEAQRGRGYAEEATRAVLGHAHDVLGLRHVCAIVDHDNAASIRLLEKLGMQRDGDLVLPDLPALAFYVLRLDVPAD